MLLSCFGLFFFVTFCLCILLGSVSASRLGFGEFGGWIGLVSKSCVYVFVFFWLICMLCHLFRLWVSCGWFCGGWRSQMMIWTPCCTVCNGVCSRGGVWSWLFRFVWSGEFVFCGLSLRLGRPAERGSPLMFATLIFLGSKKVSAFSRMYLVTSFAISL